MEELELMLSLGFGLGFGKTQRNLYYGPNGTIVIRCTVDVYENEEAQTLDGKPADKRGYSLKNN